MAQTQSGLTGDSLKPNAEAEGKREQMLTGVLSDALSQEVTFSTEMQWRLLFRKPFVLVYTQQKLNFKPCLKKNRLILYLARKISSSRKHVWVPSFYLKIRILGKTVFLNLLADFVLCGLFKENVSVGYESGACFHSAR